MRLNESAKVEKALTDAGIKLTVVNAAETFYNATTVIDGVETEKLCETVRPEVKRKIIGDTYMKVSEEVHATRMRTTIPASHAHKHTHTHTHTHTRTHIHTHTHT
jgi:GMP synthase PP-ATPase subunit